MAIDQAGCHHAAIETDCERLLAGNGRKVRLGTNVGDAGASTEHHGILDQAEGTVALVLVAGDQDSDVAE